MTLELPSLLNESFSKSDILKKPLTFINERCSETEDSEQVYWIAHDR
jgi:hypothetical protein